MSRERPPAGLSSGLLAQMACVLEATARKPGNVHPGRDFEDCQLIDFLLSASAIAGPLDRVRTIGIGAAVRQAIEATRRVVASNTNLGMVLLLAPLAAVPEDRGLSEGIGPILEATTIVDACEVYRAIRQARPGGIGTVPEQDIAGEPTVTLLEAMRLAAGHDLVARQYAGAYHEVLHEALPALRSSLAQGRSLETAIIASYLSMLAHHPDTLVARKRGWDEARAVSQGAVEVLAAGWPDAPAGLAACDAFDGWLRDQGHTRNPGATADLIAAALFAALRDGTIPLPRPPGPSGWSLPL